jgi:hypothetical protein
METAYLVTPVIAGAPRKTSFLRAFATEIAKATQSLHRSYCFQNRTLFNQVVIDRDSLLRRAGRCRRSSQRFWAHISKLEEGGYVRIEEEFVEKKPHTLVRLTDDGRKAFAFYRFQFQKLISTRYGKYLLVIQISNNFHY